MKCRWCESAGAEMLAPDLNRNFVDLLDRMRKVKNGKFRCKFHNQPVQQRDGARWTQYCRLCDAPEGATEQTQAQLKNDTWHLTSLVAEAREALADISFLLAEVSDKDTLDSLSVADVFCMVESKYNYLKDLIASWTGLRPTARRRPEAQPFSSGPRSACSRDAEETHLDQEHLVQDIQHEVLMQNLQSSDEQPAEDARLQNLSLSAESAADTPATAGDRAGRGVSGPDSGPASLAEDQSQQNLNYKLTAHNKRLFEKWNKKQFGEIKNLKYKPLTFKVMREIKQVPAKFNQVNFVRHAKYQSEVSLLLYDESELRLYREDGPVAMDLRALLRNYTGLKLGFNREHASQFESTHVTCLASSNKGHFVLIGHSDGTLHKRNLKQELLKTYALEPGLPVKGCIFNDNDSVILVAQGRKILSLRADSLEQVREFTTREDVEGLDTWHGQIQAGQTSCFEIVKQSNPNFRVVFQQDCRIERFKIGRTGDQLVLVSGPHSVDVVHHAHALWKVVHRLEFSARVVNMDFLGEWLVVILDAITDRKIMTFKMTYL